MHPFRLTLRNYRAFTSGAPLRVEIFPGYTAFVGPNNSGKTSALKVIHELNALWKTLSKTTNSDFKSAMNGSVAHINYLDVEDVQEIFCVENERPLELTIELLGEKFRHPKSIVGIKAVCYRNEPHEWAFEVCVVDAHEAQRRMWIKCERTFNGDDYKIKNGNGFIECLNDKFSYVEMEGLFKALAEAVYIPAFRNIINEGGGRHYGSMVGTAFVENWKEWKTGSSREKNKKIIGVTGDIADIFEIDSLEISPSSSGKTLLCSINGSPFRLPDLGSGISQFINVFGNVVVKVPDLILIDEPELNLHPSMQIKFLMALGKYCSGNVVFATHSIGLARSTAERIYAFGRKRGKAPTVHMIDSVPNPVEFAGEMSFASYKELGSDAILLVEGVSDVKVMMHFLRLLKKDAKVVVLHLGGNQGARGDIDAALIELKRLSSHVYAIVDSERKSAASPPLKERVEFKKACERCGIKVLLTQKRAVENYFSEEAIRHVVGTECTALTDYQSLGESGNKWSKAKDNWRIACAMSKNDIENTDIGRFLADLLKDVAEEDAAS